MTQKQEVLRKNLLKKIHLHPFCKEAKSLETWESFLSRLYGVSSSAHLSLDELLNLLTILDGKTDTPKCSGVRPVVKGKATPKQLYLIDKLWNERAREPTQSGLHKMVARTIGRMPLHLASMSTIEATKVINGLRRL